MPVNANGTGRLLSASRAPLRPAWLAFVPMLCAAACTEPFTPEMPFEQRLVVYAILSSVEPEHAIRISTTYSSDALNLGGPGPDTRVARALVVVADASAGGSPVDTCVFSEGVRCYLWSPVSLTRGHRYRLSVTAPGLEPVEAVAIVPREAAVTPGNVLILREPSTYLNDFTTFTRVPSEAKGLIVQLFIDYEVNDAGAWIPGRTEVPLLLSPSAGGGLVRVIYPGLERRPGTSEGGEWAYQYTAFDHSAYEWALSQVKSRHLVQGLKFRRAVIRVTQLDEDLYNYYNIANGFRDPNTIRVDEPDYTNVVGGYGIFGAAVTDSLVIALPEVIR